jgi:hypothetical protein
MMLKTAAGTSDFTNRWMFVMILCRACGVGLGQTHLISHFLAILAPSDDGDLECGGLTCA